MTVLAVLTGTTNHVDDIVVYEDVIRVTVKKGGEIKGYVWLNNNGVPIFVEHDQVEFYGPELVEFIESLSNHIKILSNF